jgi:hypothetical protein
VDFKLVDSQSGRCFTITSEATACRFTLAWVQGVVQKRLQTKMAQMTAQGSTFSRRLVLLLAICITWKGKILPIGSDVCRKDRTVIGAPTFLTIIPRLPLVPSLIFGALPAGIHQQQQPAPGYSWLCGVLVEQQINAPIFCELVTYSRPSSHGPIHTLHTNLRPRDHRRKL